MSPALGLALAAVLAITLGAALRAGSARRAGAVAAFGAAAALLLLRQIGLAGALAFFGIGLWQGASPGRKSRPTPGKRSDVRTQGLHMTLDHDSGEMDGEVLEGDFAGARLSDLSHAELRKLAQEFAARFPEEDESFALLAAYMERIGVETAEPAPPEGAEMSEAEAYRTLGLEPGASAEEVRAAYRRLIRRVHPDLGGSSPLAAMLNAAKQKLDPE